MTCGAGTIRVPFPSAMGMMGAKDGERGSYPEIYDLNPVPADIKARVLTTNINLDEGICSVDLLEAASEFFGLTLLQAREIIREVAAVTARWRDTAKVTGARPAEIDRMASAFEHDDLKRAVAL